MLETFASTRGLWARKVLPRDYTLVTRCPPLHGPLGESPKARPLVPELLDQGIAPPGQHDRSGEIRLALRPH